MAYAIKRPDEESFLSQHVPTGARLYAELANCPLYVNARVMGGNLVGRRESLRLGWIIQEKRFAAGRDKFVIPAAVLEWAREHIEAAYPSVEEAAGLTAEEIDELKAEQKAKRAKYAKP